MNKVMRVPALIVLRGIAVYQRTLSPDHGILARLFPYGFCRYHPTCSEYGAQAISRYGLIRGGTSALLRILRCNPFTRGGFDRVK